MPMVASRIPEMRLSIFIPKGVWSKLRAKRDFV
jgi:hypothetical protein